MADEIVCRAVGWNVVSEREPDLSMIFQRSILTQTWPLKKNFAPVFFFFCKRKPDVALFVKGVTSYDNEPYNETCVRMRRIHHTNKSDVSYG